MPKTDLKEESHIALYRKYRPQTFKDVVGQEQVVNVLEGVIEGSQVSHAYLFSGSRGTGKTSIARIFANALGVSSQDLYEIDAASNTSVEDIRSLNESVNTLPFESPYKVYILDEVHMLSKSAFNAFLKTLEEPPAHAIFILATTEIDKLPETIVSRCQTFVFKKPTEEILKNVVTRVAKSEGFSIDQDAADLVALLGDGSFRDTLGTLEKVLSSPEIKESKKIQIENVETVTGAPRKTLVNDFINSLSLGKSEEVFKTIQSVKRQNIDMKVYLKLILQKMRFVLLLKYAPESTDFIKEETSSEELEFLKNLSQNKDGKITSIILSELLTAFDEIGRSSIPQLPLELAVMRIIEKSK